MLEKGTLTKPPQLEKGKLEQAGTVLQILRSIAQVIPLKGNIPKKQKERNEV